MGALRKFMPVTAATFIVGWLAIAGVPPFAGFWSKDEILLFALASRPGAVGDRPRHRGADRVLHDPPGRDGLLRRGEVGEPRRRARRARRVQAARVAAGHAVPAGRARRAGDRRRRSSSCRRTRGSPTTSRSGSSTGCTPSSSSARPRSSATQRLRQQGPARARRHRRRADRDRRRDRGVREAQGEGDRAAAARRRLVRYDAAVSEFMGGPGRKAFEAIAWFDQTVIDGAVNGVGTCRARSGAPAPQGPDRQRAQLRRHPRDRRRGPARLVRARQGSPVMARDRHEQRVVVPDPHQPRSLVPGDRRRLSSSSSSKRRPELVKLVALLASMATAALSDLAAVRRSTPMPTGFQFESQAHVDRGVGDLVAPRRRRDLAVPRRAHRRAVPALDRRPPTRTTTRSRTSRGCCCSRRA